MKAYLKEYQESIEPDKKISQQLYRPEQVRQTELEAAHLAGMTAWQLMERAGQAVLRCLETHSAAPAEVIVFCGPGNNGGDGYVLATLAHRAGFQVRVFAPDEPSENQSLEAALAMNLWLETEQPIESFASFIEDELLAKQEKVVLIDALFGSGLSRVVEKEYAAVIAQINALQHPVIAVDIPSGLHGDTGQPLGLAVQARYTVCFVGMKRGLYTGSAKAYVGQLYYADLGILREFQALNLPSAWRLEGRQLGHWLPARGAASHKGDSGHLLLVGGARGMTGALKLAAEAALRAGAGKVTAICEAGYESYFADLPEVLCYGIDFNQAEDQALFEQCVRQASHLAIGPGLGQGSWAQTAWTYIQQAPQPKVVDADALNLLAQAPVEQENWILTPHPGEAAFLLGWETEQIQSDRWKAATALQKKYGGVIVLKGSGTLIQEQEQVAVCAAGSPVLACAGTGDVLTGVIAGIWSQIKKQPKTAWEVACAGVLVHALSGERAAEQVFPQLNQPRQTRGRVGRSALLGKKRLNQTRRNATRGILASELMPQIVYWVNPE